MYARAHGECRRGPTSIRDAERAARELCPPRAACEGEIQAVVHDEPGARHRLRRLEAGSERLKARGGGAARTQVQGTSRPERRHHGAGDVEKVGTRDDLVARHRMYYWDLECLVPDGDGQGVDGRL